ncbi:tetratricopeptide repeat protein, partial [bacterium M00.F.Ca.ET.159.01.1.1]
AEAWFNRGFCWNREKQYDRAIADLDEALRLDPNHANASKERDDAAMARAANKQAPTTGGAAATTRDIKKSGIALYNKGRYDLAIAKFDQALALDSNDAEAFLYRGLAWGQKGNYDRA